MIWIECNGEQLATHAANVAELLEERRMDTTTVAVAIDGDFVPRSSYGDRTLAAGEKLEILAPMQGG